MSDIRTVVTRRLIRDAFLHFLRKKPLNEITVREVCTEAGINRSTFYKYYRDCFDLLDRIIEEELEEFTEALKQYDPFDDRLSYVIFDVLDHHRDLNELLLAGRASENMIRQLLARAKDVCFEAWKRNMPKATEREAEMVFTCMTTGICHLIILDFYSAKPEERKRLADFIHRCLKNGVAPYT